MARHYSTCREYQTPETVTLRQQQFPLLHEKACFALSRKPVIVTLSRKPAICEPFIELLQQPNSHYRAM